MTDRDRLEMNGEVVDASKSIFKVKTDAGSVIQCTLGGKIRINNVKILIGDKVSIEVSPYDLTRGRIIYRIK